MLGKLRPVGSNVPAPAVVDAVLPWEDKYSHEFTRSGTDALSLAVRLAIFSRPDIDSPAVLMPAYGCPDLVAAVVSQGAMPVAVDLADNQTPTMDIEGVKAGITSNTVAVIAVGFLGLPERLGVLSEVCHANNLLLIEDSAQCFPPESIKRGIADLVILSFGRGKPINLMGGGALLIREDHLSRFFPVVSGYPVISLKINFVWYVKRFLFNLMLSRLSYGFMEKVPFLRLGETRLHLLKDVCRLGIPKSLVTAGVAQYQLRPGWQKVYDKQLSFLDEFGWIRLHSLHELGESEGSLRLRYAMLAPSRKMRDRMITQLNSAGIAANSFYGEMLPGIEGVAERLGIIENYPAAGEFASRLVTLPCHEGVTEEDVGRIVACFRAEFA